MINENVIILEKHFLNKSIFEDFQLVRINCTLLRFEVRVNNKMRLFVLFAFTQENI